MKSRRIQQITLLCFTALCAALPASAQLPTNATLKGAYWVRYLGVIGYPQDYPASFAGSMTFDGNGNYTVTGSGVYNSGSSNALPLTGSGTYAILSSGQVAMDNPFSQGAAALYGGIGTGGIVIASSTESQYLDLFILIPQSSSASKATLSGAYHVGDMEFAGGSINSMSNAYFDVNADGNGNLGTITVNGSSTALNDSDATQTISGATYTLVAGGSGTMTFPAPSGSNPLISGAKNLYVSPDGTFFIAGSPSGWDLQVGVKALGSTGGATIFSGLYYTGYLSNTTGSDGTTFAFSGSVNELPSITTELYHDRTNQDGFAGAAYDATGSDIFVPGANGTAYGGAFAVGTGGNTAFIVGGDGLYSMQVYSKIPSYSGSGVFLNPTAVVNAGSNTPFTAQLSPGEVITLYGTGFTSSSSPSTASAPFPPTLGGVQVMINGSAAPVYYVSQNQISAVVPYSTPSNGSLVTVQVIGNGGGSSNTVQCYTGLTSPGVFTVPTGGVGNAAILHADFTLVSDSSPAKPGETVQLFLTGLGATSPSVTAGTAAPSAAPFPTLVYPVDIFIDDFDNQNFPQATVTFSGLAPGLGGLYQVNFTLPPAGGSSGMILNPTGVTHFYLEVSMLEQADGDNIQAFIPVSH